MTNDTKAPERFSLVDRHPTTGLGSKMEPDDQGGLGAQTAFEAHDKRIREETLMGAAAYVRAAFVGCDRVADAIETLIEKEQTDE